MAGLTALAVRGWRYVVVGVLSTAICSSVVLPLARADGLDEQKKKVEAQISRTRAELDESTSGLVGAEVALQRAEAALTTARSTLTTTTTAVAAATTADQAAAKTLKDQQAALARANSAVTAGQQAIVVQKRQLALMVSDQYQKQTNVLPLAILAQSSSLGDLQSRVQMSTTMLDTSQSQFARLSILQKQLLADQAEQTRLEHEVAAARVRAAAVLATKQTLQRRAAAQAATVASLVTQRAAAKTKAADEVAADRQHYAALQTENASVERRIEVRIAKAKAEAARKAAAERAAAAARKAAAERRAAAARKAAAEAKRAAAAAKSAAARRAARQRAAAARKAQAAQAARAAQATSSRASATSSRRPASSAAASASGHHGFIYPVNAPITSPYGRRFHPILHVWKLHDGTDFGASCGTAIHAAYGGRVEERYFNAGYGNRLIIDHGKVDGRYVSTAYNHATRYVVGVGQHVAQGQVIGYVGQTGYATGCHLHLMVYLNGRMVNPMSWY